MGWRDDKRPQYVIEPYSFFFLKRRSQKGCCIPWPTYHAKNFLFTSVTNPVYFASLVPIGDLFQRTFVSPKELYFFFFFFAFNGCGDGIVEKEGCNIKATTQLR